MSGGKLIVARTLAVLRSFFFAASTRFAFWGFRLTITVCHHVGEIEHKSPWMVNDRVCFGKKPWSVNETGSFLSAILALDLPDEFCQ